MFLKNFLKKIFSYRTWNTFLFYYQHYKFYIFKIYSCRGSIDKELIKILNKKRNGFFLEVGAYNGISESISLRLETELNWRGILIEPNPIHYNFLKKNRSKNICLNFVCLNEKNIHKKLYLKNLNQMSYLEDADNEYKLNNYPIDRIEMLAKKSMSGDSKKYICEIQTLKNIFKTQKIYKIDLAIIDVEGSEIELLKGIEFSEVDIEYFCIETYNFSKLDTFMKRKNYKFLKKIHKEDYVYKKNS